MRELQHLCSMTFCHSPSRKARAFIAPLEQSFLPYETDLLVTGTKRMKHRMVGHKNETMRWCGRKIEYEKRLSIGSSPVVNCIFVIGVMLPWCLTIEKTSVPWLSNGRVITSCPRSRTRSWAHPENQRTHY